MVDERYGDFSTIIVSESRQGTCHPYGLVIVKLLPPVTKKGFRVTMS